MYKSYKQHNKLDDFQPKTKQPNKEDIKIEKDYNTIRKIVLEQQKALKK